MFDPLLLLALSATFLLATMYSPHRRPTQPQHRHHRPRVFGHPSQRRKRLVTHRPHAAVPPPPAPLLSNNLPPSQSPSANTAVQESSNLTTDSTILTRDVAAPATSARETLDLCNGGQARRVRFSPDVEYWDVNGGVWVGGVEDNEGKTAMNGGVNGMRRGGRGGRRGRRIKGW